MIYFILGFFIGVATFYALSNWKRLLNGKQKTEKFFIEEEFKKQKLSFCPTDGTLFGHKNKKFFGYTFSLDEVITCPIGYIKVEISNIDVKKRHIYLKIVDFTYLAEVTEIIDNEVAVGCTNNIYGSITFIHNLDVKWGSKVKVELVEINAGVYEPRGVGFW